MHHVKLLLGFYDPVRGQPLKMAGVEDCGSPSLHRSNKEMVAEQSLVRHFLFSQDTLREGGEEGVLSNVLWVRGPDNPVDGLAEHKSDMLPHLPLWIVASTAPNIRLLSSRWP